MSFLKKKYKVVKKAIPENLAHFITDYFCMKRQVNITMLNSRYISPFQEDFGVWNDKQVPNTYSHYSDIAMETLLLGLLPKMEKESGMKLVPTYSYARIYKKGDILKRHKDRKSCEISTTLHLGGDRWPIFIEPSGKVNKKGVKVNLKSGEMLMYKGCDLEHWREPFTGEMCAQVFLHYNKKTKNASVFDDRPHVGLSGWFRQEEQEKKQYNFIEAPNWFKK